MEKAAEMMDIFRKCAFLVGPGPIRRTLPYLNSGKLVFKDRVKVMEVHYNRMGPEVVDKMKPKISNPHEGLKDFYFWIVPQIQYKNPHVQIVRFKDMFPNPFIRCWLDDGRDVMFECYMKRKEDILEQLIKILGKTKERQALESSLNWEEQNWKNKAMFGLNRERYCMCEVPGQVPCPGILDLPKKMQGKYLRFKKEELEQWENDLDAPYETQEEIEKKHKHFPLPQPVAAPYFKGLEKMEIKKTYRYIPPSPGLIEHQQNAPKDYTKDDEWSENCKK